MYNSTIANNGDKPFHIQHGDCLELLQQVSSSSIDLILCDLPYGTTQNKWDTVVPLESLWEQYSRILKSRGVVVLTGQGLFSAQLALSAKVKYQYSAVWVKPNHTNQLNAKRQLLRKHEDILIFYNQQPTYNPQGLVPKGTVTKQGRTESSNWGAQSRDAYIQEFTNYPTTLIATTTQERGLHPTQKPTELLEYLINTFTNPGDTVLDNCMGSGSTGVAALRLGRKFIGMEKEQVYFEPAKGRIEETWEALAKRINQG